MSFVHEILHAVKCDRCGELHGDIEYTYYTDEQSAEEQAIESDWICLDGKHYCRCCYTEDEEGNKTPLPRLPKIYWTVREAMKKLDCTNHTISQENNTMTVSCYTFLGEEDVNEVESWIMAHSSPCDQYSMEHHYVGKLCPRLRLSVTIQL